MTGNDKGHVKVKQLFPDAAVIHTVMNTTLRSFQDIVARGKHEVQSMPYSYRMITMAHSRSFNMAVTLFCEICGNRLWPEKGNPNYALLYLMTLVAPHSRPLNLLAITPLSRKRLQSNHEHCLRSFQHTVAIWPEEGIPTPIFALLLTNDYNDTLVIFQYVSQGRI